MISTQKPHPVDVALSEMAQPDIRPTLSAPDSPTCSGEACPAWELSKGYFICSVQSEPRCDGKSRSVVLANAGHVCLPGLRRLLATRTEALKQIEVMRKQNLDRADKAEEERDAAQAKNERLMERYRTYISVPPQLKGEAFRDLCAELDPVSYLYAPAPPATGTEEGE